MNDRRLTQCRQGYRTIAQILDLAGFYGLHLDEADAASFRRLMAGPIASSS
jgi:hypothetical protein